MGPGISPLEQTMLSLMSEVIAVAALEYFSFDGLEIFEDELAKIRRAV
jgi:cellulose biosynthesis protein BcsQ